ncbi:MAG: GTP cyclohydrolase [Desulfurococcales archaeon ex4484_58]|nr:MAG: GTP cyclohydrolase [Desulfurococcales archaeon ex4484_58]
MPRITLIKLLKYREWTEELGSNREGIIQIKQSTIYGIFQEKFWEKQCFVLPFRFDYYIVLSNGLSKEDLEVIVKETEQYTPYGIKAVSLTHKYPAIAQMLATKLLHRNDKIIFLDGEEDENVIVHIDLNNITELTDQTSVYESYLEILMLYYYIAKYVFELGGIANYLGGDNLIAIIPYENLERLLNVIPSNVKVGVGVSYYPREALRLAAQALSTIRKKETTQNYLVLNDTS